MSKYRHAKGISGMQLLLIVAIVVVTLGVIVGGVFATKHLIFDKQEPTQPPTTAPTQPATELQATEAPTEDANSEYTSLAQEKLNTMSLDDKIYQMLTVTPEALTGVDIATIAGDTTKEALEKYPVGGIYYSEGNFEDEEQTKELISKTQSFAKTPMFIAVCDEGGENSPLASKFNADTTGDSMYEKRGDSTVLTYCSSIAFYISGLGVNVNLAPSANHEGDNIYPTGAKSVGELTSTAIKGFYSKGVIPVVKYFPVPTDTEKNLDQLREEELMPFTTVINNGVGGTEIIAVSSAKVTAVDEVPSFMSQRIVTEVLIKELNFDGVVMTPDLSDTAITDEYTTEEIAVGAINAGADVLFCPDNIEDYVSAIKTAIEDNKITEDQIDKSVTKILALKYKHGIIKN